MSPTESLTFTGYRRGGQTRPARRRRRPTPTAPSSTAAGVAVVFAPLLLLGVFPDGVRTRIEQLTPVAGMAIQSTTGRMLSAFDGHDRRMPIAPWAGLGVAFAWALGTLAIGYLLLRARDA